MARVLVGALAPTLAWAQRNPDFYGHPMMWGGWYGMFFGPLMIILFIAAVVVLVVLAVRWFGGPGMHPHAPPPKTALDILKERLLAARSIRTSSRSAAASSPNEDRQDRQSQIPRDRVEGS